MGIQELSVAQSLGHCVSTLAAAWCGSIGSLYLQDARCRTVLKIYKWPCNTIGLVMPSSFVLIPMSICVTWELRDNQSKHPSKGSRHLFCLSHLCKLDGKFLSQVDVNFVTDFHVFCFSTQNEIVEPLTHVGYLGELLCKFHYCLPLLCVYLHATDLWVRPANSTNAPFLSVWWCLVDWKQQNVSKTFRSSAARGCRAHEETLLIC